MSKVANTAIAQDRPAWRIVAGVGTLLILYFVLERWLLASARLPATGYDQPILLVELLRRSFVPEGSLLGSAQRVVPTLALCVVLLRWRGALTAPWRGWTGGPHLRVFVGVVTAVLAWAYATYDYNLYFDRAHLLDRAVLLGLAVAVVWRPIFVWPFLALAVAMLWQFSYPIGHFSVAQPFVLVRILLLFLAAWLLRAITRRSWSAEFLFLAITVLASAYLRCGVGKVLLGASDDGLLNWATHGHLYFLLLATHANGWLGHLDQTTVTSFAQTISRFDRIMVVGTLLLECGALFALLRRRILFAFLAGWIGFHLGVFALSGIFFWKWMLVEATLAGVLLARGSAQAFPIFKTSWFVLSLGLIVAGMSWFRPVNLAWYDSPLSYTYRFVGVGESGTRYALPPRFFAPYDYQFTLGNFHYAADYPGLDITWGAIWDRGIVEQLLQPVGLAEIEAMERAEGRNRYDAEDAERLESFVRTFVTNYNRRRSKETILSAIAAPPHLWSMAPANAYDGNEPLVEVAIHQVTGYFDGARFDELRDREIRRIPIVVSTPR